MHASESQLRAMLETALDAVVTMDHRGRVIGWNHAAETTFGCGYPTAPALEASPNTGTRATTSATARRRETMIAPG